MPGRRREPARSVTARRRLFLVLALSTGALAIGLRLPPVTGPSRLAAAAAVLAAIVYLGMALHRT